MRTFDVCIVCALPEEVRALLEVVRQQSEGTLEEYISPYRSSYYAATIKNKEGEPLTLYISWLPRYGRDEMTLHLSRMLEGCRPRLAIMTGICAGDAQRVLLGDIIVAERTFTYDNGKVVIDDEGRRLHEHDTLTYQLDPNILQFLGLFDAWRPLVARLKRPSSSLEERETACHIKALASGSAVRADNPFADVRIPVRGTVAIDMEGAAFSMVMSRPPQIPWLVVKGVCDYADRAKNDTYHGYAAHVSALYALSFIQAYVTTERLPPAPAPQGSVTCLLHRREELNYGCTYEFKLKNGSKEHIFKVMIGYAWKNVLYLDDRKIFQKQKGYIDSILTSMDAHIQGFKHPIFWHSFLVDGHNIEYFYYCLKDRSQSTYKILIKEGAVVLFEQIGHYSSS